MESILIIEDDINIAELERDYLKLNGYNVTVENDGDKGLKKALTGIYEVLIVDLMLPNKDGYEIIDEVRKKFEIPIIVVSAKCDDIDKIRGLGFGADDYIQKPFSPAELVARIKSHLQRYKRLLGQNTSNSILSFKGLEVNTASHRVFVSNKEIQLTTKEFELLVFFMSNSNIVFSKEHLFNSIWGEDCYGEMSTLPVYVQRLRKKIEKNPENPEYIETIWGSGYRFNSN